MSAAAVLIVDETSSRQRLREFRLELASERITAEELIRRRVRAEVDAWNARPADVYSGLVQPTGAERVLNGFRLRARRRLDPDAQERAALDAFRRNGFLLLVRDRQVTELDEEILITPELLVRFVRLVPLVGG